MIVRMSRVAALAPLMLAATVAARAENVAIDQQVFTQQKSTVTLKGLQASDSSLSKDAIVRMLSPDTPKAERTDLIKAFKASRLVIPSVEIKDEKAAVKVRDIAAEQIDGGRFAKLTVAGAEGANGDDLKFTAKALTMEDGDFSSIATALATGEAKLIAPRVGTTRFDGLSMTIREDGPKDKAGLIEIGIGVSETRREMDGDVPRSASFSMKNLTVTPKAGSKLGRDLSAFGYDKIDVSARTLASYDQATRAFKLEDFTIDGAGAGALTLAMSLGNVDKTFAAADPNQSLAAFMAADISQASLKFVNAGLMDRALAYFAGARSKETVRSEWAKAAGQYIPIILGGDAGALSIASEAQKFLNDPRSLLITAKGKDGPVPLMELSGLKDPSELLKRVELGAAANK